MLVYDTSQSVSIFMCVCVCVCVCVCLAIKSVLKEAPDCAWSTFCSCSECAVCVDRRQRRCEV